jgi:ubiquinone/menaquinone biosynthesis C-methylase UbiE
VVRAPDAHASENGDPTRNQTRKTYRRIAPFYDLIDLPFEYGRYRSIRPLLFHGLRGRILDAGVGTGRNMSFYPAGSKVVGVDLSPEMLERARRRTKKSPASVQLLQMDVARLDFADASFDAAVASFLFCTLPEELQLPALRELNRVVKPNGSIRLMEYTPPQRPLRRAIAKLFSPWVRWAFGASLDRNVEQIVRRAGLIITHAQNVTSSIQFVEVRATPVAKP